MRISIITASFNSEKTIENTIRSVLSQTHPDLEYIIIDGGSTDQTLTLANKYRDKISKIVSEKDNGIFDAMNKGIRLASGDIIGILNSDDVYADEKVLAKVAAEIEKTGAETCWGDLVYVKKDNLDHVTRVWKSSSYVPGFFQKGGQLPHPAVFVRKDVYERYGVFNTELAISADYEIMLRFLEKYKVSFAYIPEVFVKMREGGNSNWKNLFTVIAGNRDVNRSWEINNLSIRPYTILFKILRKVAQISKNNPPSLR